MQADLIGCQAKIGDLEKALAERGQVKEEKGGEKTGRSLAAPLSLALLLVCLGALLLAWRYGYADRICRRIL